jgi:hypothetical protein
MHRVALAVSLLAAGALAPAAAVASSESSFRCDGGLVAVGDLTVDLLGKCGDPALRDVLVAEAGVATLRKDPLAVDAFSTEAAVEQWTFNFGPNRFLMIVTVESGHVVRIERGGYGYSAEKLKTAEKPRCESSTIRVGDQKIDVLAKCGSPTTQDARREKRGVSGPGPAGGGASTTFAYATVLVETWIYDLGPNRFIVIATLENGTVTAVDHGGYGYRR